MKLKTTATVVIVGMSEYVIKSGERAGEVVHRVSLSNGEELFQDVNISDSVDVSALVLFTQPYEVTFDYSVRSFNDRVWKQFAVDSLVPVKA